MHQAQTPELVSSRQHEAHCSCLASPALPTLVTSTVRVKGRGEDTLPLSDNARRQGDNLSPCGMYAYESDAAIFFHPQVFSVSV